MAVTFDGSHVPDEDMEGMARAAEHRGPDGIRRWSGPDAAAAHLSLEVSREDGRDRQPRVVGSLVCVADVRIDNRPALAVQLRHAGLLSSEEPTDSEVVLAAYRHWGAECARHLEGDFAFAVYDTRARRVFAARDAMGARTLHYRTEPRRRLLLATEPSQIAAAPGVPARPNEAAVLADIAGLYALPTVSHYAGIDQLPPAHALLVDGEGSRTWRYWDITAVPTLRHRRREDYAEHFREVLDQAVRARLRSDRPAGMFLSGGLDSMAIAAVGARLAGADGLAPTLRGFSWAFTELSEADERHVSAPVARELGLAVTDVPGDEAWPLRRLPEVGPDRDDPFMWLYQDVFERTLTAARADGVRLMLTSDRGDELTGGWAYDDLGLLLSGRWRMLAQDRRAFRGRTGQSDISYLRNRLLEPLATTLWPPSDAGFRGRLPGSGTRPRPLAPWVPELAAERYGLSDIIRAAMPVPEVRGHARLQRMMTITHVISLRVAAHRQRTFARFGLQYADPWGDRRLAELVCSIPQWVVQRQSGPKKITRDAMRGLLPDAARLSPAPSNHYPLFHRAFNERETGAVRTLLQDSRAEALGLLDARAVLAAYESYLRGEDQSDDFWYPLTVELWLRRWWD